MMKRSFILLRREDNMRAPRPTLLRTLQSCGRVRELNFANNSTRGVIQELLWNSFAQLRGVAISK